jgi:hypothetical protein
MDNGFLYDSKKIEELENIYINGEIKPVDELFTIEDVAMKIQEMNKKLDWLKEYKKKKTDAIATEIKATENKVDFFRQVISKTLTVNNEKSVSFPDSCRVSKVKRKGKWVVVDEDALADLMKKEEKFNEVFEEVTTTVLDKKILNTLLDTWKKNGHIDEIDVSKCVEKEEDKVTISIKYEEKKPEETRIEDIFDEDIPVKSEEVYDAL